MSENALDSKAMYLVTLNVTPGEGCVCDDELEFLKAVTAIVDAKHDAFGVEIEKIGRPHSKRIRHIVVG